MASQDNCSYKEMELDIPGHPRKLPLGSPASVSLQALKTGDVYSIKLTNRIFLLLNEDAADKNQLCFISLQLFP